MASETSRAGASRAGASEASRGGADQDKYSILALSAVHDSAKFRKKLQEDAATDADNLEKKRIEFAKRRAIIEGLIQKIQKNTAKRDALLEAADAPECDPVRATQDRAAADKVTRDNEYLFSSANLLSITGMYEGLGLIADSLSVSMVEKNEKTKQKEYYRIPVAELLFDMAALMEKMGRRQRQIVRMVHLIGNKQQAFFRDREILEQPDQDDQDGPDSGVTEGLSPGVSEADLAAARRPATEEELERAVRGER